MLIKKIILASDHAGWELKNELKNYLKKQYPDLNILDFGPKEYKPDDDYPDYILPAAEKAVKEKYFLIAICASGVGACISSNKVKGMYAAPVFNEEIASLARQHNHVNGICLAAKFLSKELAIKIIDRVLNEENLLTGKYERRLNKIKSYEQKN